MCLATLEKTGPSANLIILCHSLQALSVLGFELTQKLQGVPEQGRKRQRLSVSMPHSHQGCLFQRDPSTETSPAPVLRQECQQHPAQTGSLLSLWTLLMFTQPNKFADLLPMDLSHTGYWSLHTIYCMLITDNSVHLANCHNAYYALAMCSFKKLSKRKSKAPDLIGSKQINNKKIQNEIHTLQPNSNKSTNLNPTPKASSDYLNWIVIYKWNEDFQRL